MKLILQIILFIKKSIDTLISLAKIVIKSNFLQKPFKPNNKTTCFVFGNGPSINDDIKKFKNNMKLNDVFVVNFFAKSDYFFEIKPNNYILLDNAFFEKENTENYKEFYETLKNKIDWEINFHLPNFARKSDIYQNYLSKNKFIKILFYNYTVYNGFDKFGYFLMNKNLCMTQSQNIVVAALLRSIQVGYKSVFIFGAENSWHTRIKVNHKNQLFYEDIHLYDTKENPNRTYLMQGKLHDQMNSLYKLFLGYQKVQKYAVNNKCHIYNCTKNSYIDAFPRLNDDEFIEKINK
jgi:hypothetical protein